MLIIFAFVIVAFVIATICYRCCDWKNPKSSFFVPLGVSLLVFFAICVITWGTSYQTYLKARTFYDATQEQYANAVVMYKGYAEIDLQSAAWTDLKYQGYQENIASFIMSLRTRIIEYNANIVSKRVMKANMFFSWFIVAPDDDMLVIKMTDKRNE